MSKIDYKVKKEPGLIHTISGREINLMRLRAEDVDITDIAWGLGRTLRYGGHIREDWSVAHHCIVMSYLVPKKFALEALLHDAAEAYVGDIIWPVKSLFPDIELFENELTLTIMEAFDVHTPFKQNRDGAVYYVKSDIVAEADRMLLEHECNSMDRGGTFIPEVEASWLLAVDSHMEYWFAAQYAYLQRYEQLTNNEGLFFTAMDTDVSKLSDELNALWFPKDQAEIEAKRAEEQKDAE
jgi:hypothetical protein